KEAQTLLEEASGVLDLLRRRSECRKLVRRMLAPKKGRSPAKIFKKLQEAGINDIGALGQVDPTFLKKIGIMDKEAEPLLLKAKMLENYRILREAGIPAASIKKYFNAGILSPDDFFSTHSVSLAERVGLSLSTVQRHVDMIARFKGKTPPIKYTRAQVTKGEKELRSIPGLTNTVLEKLRSAGIINGTLLVAENSKTLAGRTGVPESKNRGYQAVLQERTKKEKNDIIVI
ncbi:MAG: DNA topoisomerase I, partial [Methanoregulaceae archaeon]|nr:DNA topoisomerase I [Methanoregulaceae archaeon]